MLLIRLPRRSLFGIHDIERVSQCLLTRLRVQFSDLREDKFRHNFQCFCPICCCQTATENNKHFLLRFPCHSGHCKDLLDYISNVVDVDLENLSSTDLCDLLLHGNSRISVDTDHHIIESIIFLIIKGDPLSCRRTKNGAKRFTSVQKASTSPFKQI